MTAGLRYVRQYPTLTSLPSRGILPPQVSVILPIARTNIFTNPSIETNTNSFTAVGGSIARSATKQYHGTYSLAITPSAGTNSDGAFGSGFSLTNGQAYAFSCKFNGIAGVAYQIYLATTGGVALSTVKFIATGRWQWVYGYYTETATNNRRFYFTKDNNANAGVFYVDGVQVEAINAGETVSTYIDGDQQGLLVNQQPPAYLWTGAPHASTSTRSALTRAGGYVVNLSAYNFLLTGLLGFGMAVPNNVSIPYSVLDGARYIRTTKPPRALTLTGRVQADDPFTYQQGLSDLRAAFDRDLVPLQQPLLLMVEPQDECGTTIGDFATVPCIYAGGLEGNDSNFPAEDVAPTFTMYVPFLLGGSGGAALTVQQSVANANAILTRSPIGVWSAMGTGASGGSVLALARGLDGKIYAAGSFTGMGGVANTSRIAYWDGSAWNAMGTGAADNSVAALCVGPDGSIYAAGSFTGMGGVANTAYVAKWNGSAWSALGTGGSGGSGANAIIAAPNGNIYIGGSFTLMGGVANTVRIAYWNGSAWNALSTGATGNVLALAWGPDGKLYAGGQFTTIGGVAINRIAKWDGSAWSTLTSGGGANNDVKGLAFGPNGILYVVGSFTSIGGPNYQAAVAWNGTTYTPLSATYYTATRGTVYVAPNGDVYLGGSGIASPPAWWPDQAITRWIGTETPLGIDADMPGTATGQAWLFFPDGSAVAGFSTTGTATTAANITATNATQNYVYPVLTIKGPTSGSSQIYQIVNYTTGYAVYLNYAIQAGETATFVFDPQNPSFTSTFSGDLTSTILPGSNPSLMYLAPGANTISFFAADSSVVATLFWQNRYNGTADLVN